MKYFWVSSDLDCSVCRWRCLIRQHCWNCVQRHLQTLQSKSELTQKTLCSPLPWAIREPNEEKAIPIFPTTKSIWGLSRFWYGSAKWCRETSINQKFWFIFNEEKALPIFQTKSILGFTRFWKGSSKCSKEKRIDWGRDCRTHCTANEFSRFP